MEMNARQGQEPHKPHEPGDKPPSRPGERPGEPRPGHDPSKPHDPNKPHDPSKPEDDPDDASGGVKQQPRSSTA